MKKNHNPENYKRDPLDLLLPREMVNEYTDNAIKAFFETDAGKKKLKELVFQVWATLPEDDKDRVRRALEDRPGAIIEA